MQALALISPCVEGKEEPFKFTITKKKRKKNCTTRKRWQADHLILIYTVLKDFHTELFLEKCTKLFPL